MSVESMFIEGARHSEPEAPRPPVDYPRLEEQLRVLLAHSRTFGAGRISRFDRDGNEISGDQ